MISGFRVTQMVRTAALLGISDALANGPGRAPVSPPISALIRVCFTA